MLTPPLLLLALAARPAATPAPGDTIRLAGGQSSVWYRRPGIRLIVAAGDSIARLAITVREPQFFETTTLTLSDEARRDSIPLAVLQSDSSSIDARTDNPLHTLWFRTDLPHLRSWAAAAAPGARIGKIRSTLEPAGKRKLRAAVARMTPAAR